MFEELIDLIREDGAIEGAITVGQGYTPTGEPPLVVGLARFQSYRGRTQAALIQELEAYVEDGRLNTLHFKVLDDSTVILW